MLSMTIFESIVAATCPVTGDTPLLGQPPQHCPWLYFLPSTSWGGAVGENLVTHRH